MKQIKPLSAKEVASYKPVKLPHKLPDGDGLFLCFLASGLKVWRYRVRTPNKDSWATLGHYPDMGLAEARRARDKVRLKVLAGGVTPAEEKKAAKKKEASKNTFETVARAWMASDAPHASPETRGKREGLLTNYLAPCIGGRDIATLKKADLLEAAKSPLAGDAPKGTVPRRLALFIGNVFEYARLHEIIPDDRFPDVHLVKLLPKTPPVKHRACLTEPEDIGKLMRGISQWYLRCQEVHVGLALRLMPYVFLRASELTGGFWNEVDFKARLWTIPAERMKMTRPHIVPLSRQALELLEEAKSYAGDSAFIFPSARAKKTGHISGAALLNALKSQGWNTDNEMSLHGFRGTFTTTANEAGYSRDAIELQMAHVDKNSVRAAYNHASYMPERRTMMQEYADYLDSLRQGKVHTMREWKEGQDQ